MRTRRFLLLFASAFLIGSEVCAQLPVEEGVEGAPAIVPAGQYLHSAAPGATAIRAAEPIRIDGRLDEEVWTSAPPIVGLMQLDPSEGQPASERTEVRIAYDDQALFVGAYLYDSQPVTTILARRDAGISESDFFVILIDSYHDHETAYRFSTNPSGVKRDAIVSGGGTGGGDSSWDPVWDLATQVSDSGWLVEMRIPFSQLRFSGAEEQVWGIQIERRIHRKQELATFPFTPKLERGGVQRFAHLDGIRGIRPGRRLELLPFAATRGEYLQLSVPEGVGFPNPFRSGADYVASAGVDLKYGLSSNVTLDVTFNPDFGQVELDPSVINLTAFETRFAERRPFFVEGADIFRFGEGGPAGSTGQGPQLLYSRRIGRAPQGSVPGSAVFSDRDAETTILGAAKVTGRFGDGWSVGVLEAATARESASYVDSDAGHHALVVEPAANYFVGRARRQIRGGETRFGIIAAAANRALAGTGLDGRLHASAYSGGIDIAHDWAGRTWRVAGTFTASQVNGAPGAITRTQRSSTRYYHRIDADHLSVDPAATSLAGYYTMVDVARLAGSVQAKVALAFASPGYEVNDLGFQSASDRIILDTNFTYEQNRPGRYLRSWNTRGGPDAIWNYGGERIFGEFNMNLAWVWLNYWGAGFRLAYNPPTLDDRLTRSGPMARQPRGYSGNVTFNSDTRLTSIVRGTYNGSVDAGGSWQSGGNLNLTLRPRENLDIRFGPSFSRRVSSAQYVTAVEDALATPTYGRRFVFAEIEQTTLSLETRLNVTFTPALSLELYLEPFFSSASYGTPKEFREPRAFEFATYGEDIGTSVRGEDGTYVVDPDGSGPAPSFTIRDQGFTRRSLTGNAVLRWEWRPGSTLFLVWQQIRSGSINPQTVDGAADRVGTFDLGRDVRALAEMRPDNVFVVKVNYWISP